MAARDEGAAMMAVIFELEPAAGAMQHYLDLAASLREELSAIDGFISIERFESLTHKGKILSLSFWRDEESIRRWRTLEAHRAAQARGRSTLFASYRLRVAEVMRDYGKDERAQAPQDSRAVHGD